MRHCLFLTVFFLLIAVQPFWATLDYSDLNSLVSTSELLLKNAVEGTEKGLYQSGAIQGFRTSVDSAISAGAICSTVLQLDSVIDQLHDDYLAFLKKRHGIKRPLISDNYWEISSATTYWGSHNVHDPTAIKTKGYFYVYGTDAAWAQTVKGIPYRRSRDLVNWEYLGTVFNGSYPSINNTWIDSLSGESGHTQTGIWAPYIMKVGEEYRLYYCSIHDPDGAVICLAVAPHPTGPWTQRGPIVYYMDDAGIATNAIDPTITIGKDGKYWMAWGSWSKGIYMTELDTLTGLKKSGASEFVIARNRGTTWSTMEGPEIIYNPTFNKYYLFVAEGDLGTIYQTRVARSSNPNGPYVDYKNYSTVNTTYKDLYPLLSYAYQFTNHPGWQGVAHCGVINVNGTYFMLNQGRPSSIPSMMDMHVKKIYWTEDGWPVISPERYANPGIMPEITANLIAGTWEEILLDEIKSSGVSNDLPSDAIKEDPSQFLCTPSTLVFATGGTISPSGTWSYDGQYMTIVKGGYTYKVSVDWEWDWENGCETLIYTGLRSDGRSMWGKKSMYLDRESVNMVENSTFDLGMRGYVKTATSGSVTTSITDATSGVLNYISGNTFNAIVNSTANYYYDQSISWRFPAQKAARYKVSFKYRVDTTTPLHIELQESAKDYTALYREELSFSDGGTMEFITNDVSLTDPFYTLNFQYGTSTEGVSILLDNVSIYDLTGQWDGNYIVNGDFECGMNSWYEGFQSSYVDYGIVDTSVIEGYKSYSLLSSKTLNRTANRLYWRAYLPAGWKYKASFDVKGTGMIDSYFKLYSVANTNPVLGSLYEAQATEDVHTYSYEIPIFSTDGEYVLAFCPQGVSNLIIDNVRLTIVADTTVDIKPAMVSSEESVKVYPNPSNGTINISQLLIGGYLVITDIQGRICLSLPVTNSQIDVSSLGKGLYMIRVNANAMSYTDKLLVY